MKVKSDAAESVKDLLCSRNLIRHSSGLHFVWRGNPSLSTTSRQVFKPWAEPQPSRCCHCCFHLWSQWPGYHKPRQEGPGAVCVKMNGEDPQEAAPCHCYEGNWGRCDWFFCSTKTAGPPDQNRDRLRSPVVPERDGLCSHCRVVLSSGQMGIS